MQEKCEKLDNYLETSVGLRGMPRKFGGGRGDGQAVGAAIKRALSRLKKSHSDLHDHLEVSLKRIYSDEICYHPPESVDWNVTFEVTPP